MRINYWDLMFGGAAVVAIYAGLWAALPVVLCCWVAMPALQQFASGIVERSRPGSKSALGVGLLLLLGVGVAFVVLAVGLARGGVL